MTSNWALHKLLTEMNKQIETILWWDEEQT
jgi:hypothetical protein